MVDERDRLRRLRELEVENNVTRYMGESARLGLPDAIAASIPPIIVDGTVPTATATGTKPNPQPTLTPVGKKIVSTYTDPTTGDVIAVYDDGTTSVISKGTLITDKANADLLAAEDKRLAGKSAYDLLFEQFSRYGLGGLIEPLKGFITEGLSPAEFTLRLRETDAYKKRFAANAQRIAKGLAALSEAEYIGLEDQYQSIMRNYGLPESYYARGDMGRQEGFERFIAGDVSAAELEDRIVTAQNRVINAAPQVADALRQFYPDITNGDILAYALDPDKALSNIKRSRNWWSSTSTRTCYWSIQSRRTWSLWSYRRPGSSGLPGGCWSTSTRKRTIRYLFKARSWRIHPDHSRAGSIRTCRFCRSRAQEKKTYRTGASLI
jgi:hypothetical protein